ncbi:MAG: hypothetical protein ABXS92_01010 [Sulfurimonas sp.]
MQLTNGVVLLLFVVAIILFFWGSLKALKTQKKVYLWAMVPVGLLILAMFFI